MRKQEGKSSNKELNSGQGYEQANTARYYFVSGSQLNHPKNVVFVQEPKAKQEVEDLQNEKASNV
jgi:hypothetical protein